MWGKCHNDYTDQVSALVTTLVGLVGWSTAAFSAQHLPKQYTLLCSIQCSVSTMHSLVSIQADNFFAHSAKCTVCLDRSANSTGAQLLWETAVVGSDYWLTINHGPWLSHATQTKKALRFVNNRYNQCMTRL